MCKSIHILFYFVQDVGICLKTTILVFFVQVHEFFVQKHVNMTTINSTMLSDGLSDEPSSPESTTFDDSDLLRSAVSDDVTAQLAAAGR